jgi:predicted metal-dependent enzyme (double-stranded beta helix superfamily)
MSLSPVELERFTQTLVERPERWRGLVRHDAAARTYAQLWDDEELNAWLICWGEGHDTGFHDHDRSGAAIAVLEGQVCEQRLRLHGAPSSQMLRAGARVYVPPCAIHRVTHWGSAPAVTIHAYSPPLGIHGAYRFGLDGELERTPVSEGEELRHQPEDAAREPDWGLLAGAHR